jgi:hypothetical protein
MEELLEQARTLVADLRKARVGVANQKAVLDKQADSQAIVQKNLLELKEKLEKRELAIQPIENAQKIIDNANRIKAEVDLEKSKVSGEWGALKTAQKNFKIEKEAGLKEVSEKKELYDRGAKENKLTKDKLDAKLKKIKEASA